MSGYANPQRLRLKTYIACEELDHTWDEQEVKAFDGLWKSGSSVYEIAECFCRDPDEVAILAIDRAKAGLIKRREGGVWGAHNASA